MPKLCINVLTNTLFPGNLDNTRGCKLTKSILLAVNVALLVFCFNCYCSLEWDVQMKLPTFRHFKSECMVIWYLYVLLCYLHVDVKTFCVAVLCGWKEVRFSRQAANFVLWVFKLFASFHREPKSESICLKCKRLFQFFSVETGNFNSWKIITF